MTSIDKDQMNQSLVDIFHQCADRYGAQPALYYKDRAMQGRYTPILWTEWRSAVVQTALGLYGLGVRAGDRVAILSENRPEWTFADLGILSLGAIVVPIYTTLQREDVSYIIENSDISAVFVSNQNQSQKVSGLRTRNGSPITIICFDHRLSSEKNSYGFNLLRERGRYVQANDDCLYKRLARGVLPDHIATIIYTSGTTGKPKGVTLSHRNFVHNYLSASKVIPISEDDISLSFLPLSHVFERLAGYYFMAFHGARIAFAESMLTVADDIQTVRPTVAAAVPRFYEKVYAGIMEKVKQGPLQVRRLFQWCRSVGLRYAECLQNGTAPAVCLKIQYAIADFIVFKKIRAKLGGRLRFFISGGAPLPKDLGEFFLAAGVLILEGYGLTETSPVISCNGPSAYRFGTVGKPLPGVEVSISKDGEILTRSPSVMQGYYQNEQATREVIKDGWFHTGDIGEIDEKGYLKITDRIKDIIVTSGGKNIAPQNIEAMLQKDEYCSQAVVIGDRRNYLVALIVLNREAVVQCARKHNLDISACEEIMRDDRVRGEVETCLRKRLQHLPSFEQVKYYAFIYHDLSQQEGELTPTMKVRRKYVMEKFKPMIDEMYQRGDRWNASQSK